MANDEDLLLIRIEATQTKMEKELNKALNNLSSAEKKIARQQAGLTKTIEQNWARVGKVVSVGALAGIVTGLGAMAKKAIETAAAIGDTAIQAGVGVERLQALRFAASQSGGSFELMDNALTALNKNLGDFVNTGGGKAAATFKALGIDKMIASGTVRDAETAFDAIVRGLQGVQSESQKAAYLAGVFGKEAGPKLLQLVNEGAGGIADLEAKARSLGIVLSADMVRAAKDADDKLAALFDVIKAQGTAAVATLAPQIADLAKSITDSLPRLITWVEKWADWFGLINLSPAAKLKVQISEINDLIADQERMKSEQTGFRGFVNRALGTGIYDQQIADLKKARARLLTDMELLPVTSTAAKKLGGLPLSKAAAKAAAPSFDNVQSTPGVDIGEYKDPFAFVAQGQKRIESITAEGEALGMSAAAADAYLWKLEALSQITETFGSVTAEQAAQVDAVAAAMQTAGENTEAYRATLAALDAALQDEAQASEMRVRQVEYLKDGLADVAAAGLYGFDSLQQAGSRFLGMLGEMILKTQVIKPLLDSLGGGGAGTGGGIFSDILGFATKAFGFAGGGYTGAGGVNTPAGIVHKGEVVFSQADIARLGGVHNVEALRRGMASARQQPAGVNVSVIHDGSTAIRYEKTSTDEIRIVAESVVDVRAASVVASDMRRPNSPMAKATKATVAAPRKKA